MKTVSQNTTNQNTLTTLHDGFDVVAGDDSRLIRGEILKCTDGHWSTKSGDPVATGTRMLVLGVADFLQRWCEQKVIETIVREPGKLLPELEELNAQIPKEQWEAGLDGQPRAPWVHAYCVYLLDRNSAGLFTYINSTIGARIAYGNLKDKVVWKRQLHGGASVLPVVALDTKPMKTNFGMKIRPEFTICEWCILGDALGNPKVKLIEADPNEEPPKGLKKVKPPSTGEELDDDIPY